MQSIIFLSLTQYTWFVLDNHTYFSTFFVCQLFFIHINTFLNLNSMLMMMILRLDTDHSFSHFIAWFVCFIYFIFISFIFISYNSISTVTTDRDTLSTMINICKLIFYDHFYISLIQVFILYIWWSSFFFWNKIYLNIEWSNSI